MIFTSCLDVMVFKKPHTSTLCYQPIEAVTCMTGFIEHYVIFRMKPWLWSTQYICVSRTVEWCILVEVSAQLVKSHYQYSQPSTLLASWDWWIPFCQSTACWVKHFTGNQKHLFAILFWVVSWEKGFEFQAELTLWLMIQKESTDRSVLVPHPKRRKWNVNENQLWNI